MHATLVLTPLLVANAFGPGVPMDDHGAFPWGSGWVAYSSHEVGQSVRSSRVGDDGDSKWTNCHTVGGANGVTYLQCDYGPNGQRNTFQGVTPEDPTAPAVTPEMLLQQALGQVKPPAPRIATAPPRGKDGLVGLPHFFWAQRGQWRTISKRATSGPVWAEVTATPTTLVVRPGAGQATVTCKGPGIAYDPSVTDQRGACTYLFTRSSAGLPGAHYKVTVSVVWTAAWTGSDGAGGPLAPMTTSTTFPLRIAEGQALIQRSS
ncbi:hypothetical protein [Microbispora amethystogenes]|uniref:ATP/GTP-binding protein n=1 Tax=Microbispora amethystogenes TaxID=1427754 RepID=A0ABQ4FLG2_9ACTN|nr:hypothetical protein [Microbispora amethystogenes]GIH35653.1 hypothetical protein Mam01_58170 [Microbispora amethystogenes]